MILINTVTVTVTVGRTCIFLAALNLFLLTVAPKLPFLWSYRTAWSADANLFFTSVFNGYTIAHTDIQTRRLKPKSRYAEYRQRKTERKKARQGQHQQEQQLHAVSAPTSGTAIGSSNSSVLISANFPKAWPNFEFAYTSEFANLAFKIVSLENDN